VGSSRRILLEMFGKKRPLFQSAILYPLKALPPDDLALYISRQFAAAGKDAREASPLLASLSHGHAFYAQKLALYAFDVSGDAVTQDDVSRAEQLVIAEQSPYFEATLQGLSAKQRVLLRALAQGPREKILSAEFLSSCGISLGGAQKAVQRLSALDLIEKSTPGGWQVVDKFFASWLLRNAGGAGPL